MADFQDIINTVSVSARTSEPETTRLVGSAQLVQGINNQTTSLTAVDSQTIRISSGGDRSFETGGNQSLRSQVPPATDNKVPRIYGQCVTGGVIVDAHKVDANTLIFAMVL